MSFPTSPTNGQIAVVNNVAYEYASANTSWTRVLSIANVIQANVVSANILSVVQAYSVTGNITTGNYFIGNGAFLTGITAGTNYSNSNVAAYLPTYTGNLVSLTGPVTTTANVTANNVLFGTGVVSGTGTVYAATVSTTGNVNSGYISTGEASVGNLISGGFVSATGNITGSYIFGNGALLTGVITSVSNINNGTSNVTVVSSGGNVTVGVGGTSNVAVVSTDTVTIKGNVLPSVNITYDLGTSTQRWRDLWLSNSTIYLGNAQISANATAVTITNPAGGTTVLEGVTPSITGAVVSASGNITGGNILTAGLISATGAITGAGITGSSLTVSTGNITGGNLLNNGLISSTGNSTAGNYLTAGLISATGNITGGNLSGTNITGTLATAAQTNITSVGTLGALTITANTTSGNLLTGGLINATGNITGGNINTNRVVGTGLTLVSTGDLTLSATGNINVNNEYINNVPTPVADGDAVNKLYVDNFVTGLNVHDAVKAATPTTLATITSGTITYYNGPGANGVDATLTTTGTFNLIDTVNVQTAGTRILVLNEANAVTNGVYVWSNATAITRATDYNSVPEVEAGDFMFVTNGNAYGNTGWIQTSSISNVGFAGNNITFTQFSGSGTYNAGTGLTLTGTTFSVNASQTQITSVGTLGSLAVTGNITGGNVSGTNIVGTLTTAAQTNITSVGTLGSLTVTANTTSGNLLTGGAISATGNITTAGLFVGTFQGNISGNLTVPGANTQVIFNNAGNAGASSGLTFSTTGNILSVTGNIIGGNLSGTSIVGTLTTAAQTNITSVGTLGSLTVTANTTSGNLLTGGLISATGNIRGAYVIGNGSQLTSLPAIKWTTLANTAPASPAPGDFWYNSTTGIKYQYINDGTGNAWVDQSYPTTFSTIAVTGNITGGNLSVSTGTITLGNIVNANGNGVGNIGSSSLYFNTVFAKATSAQYADLAEMYVADQDYPAGTVVEFGGNFEITATTQSHTPRIAGVVSTNPSYLMNSTLVGEYVLPIALTGRVPCKVSGTVRKGDQMVASSTPGIAIALDKQLYEPGCVIGKALENYNSNTVGTIEVAVGRY